MDNFCFKINAECFHDLGADIFNERENVARGRTAAVDDKSRVLFGDLGTADAMAL